MNPENFNIFFGLTSPECLNALIFMPICVGIVNNPQFLDWLLLSMDSTVVQDIANNPNFFDGVMKEIIKEAPIPEDSKSSSSENFNFKMFMLLCGESLKNPHFADCLLLYMDSIFGQDNTNTYVDEKMKELTKEASSSSISRVYKKLLVMMLVHLTGMGAGLVTSVSVMFIIELLQARIIFINPVFLPEEDGADADPGKGE